MITKDFVKPGAAVLDVGINRVTDRSEFERFFAGNRNGRNPLLPKDRRWSAMFTQKWLRSPELLPQSPAGSDR